ncbi:MAG TPA: hypothetical protein VMV13_01490 [Candidatus Binataceae bacterium]|nr:hypothetical protein [Candidatus Binataceae bacterium]
MKSWDALPDRALADAGEITRAFVSAGANDFRAAARYVHALPYGRNSSRTDPQIVMRERRGTCSTKHALLARLAVEQRFEIALVIGIYRMSERNTPGVGRVLAANGLEYLPEAHCYLRYRANRIDVTREIAGVSAEPIARFLHEEEISPEQIGDYKVALHQRWIREWIASPDAPRRLGFDELWKIREACIAALGQ